MLSKIMALSSNGKTGSPVSAKDPFSLARYERTPKGHNVRLIDQNRLEGFVSTGQWG
jgi:hypothetical protein